MDDITDRLRLADCKLRGRALEDHADALCREAAAEIEQLRADAIEQARIIGMGAERELALLAQIQEFRQVQLRLMNDLQACKDALAQWEGKGGE